MPTRYYLNVMIDGKPVVWDMSEALYQRLMGELTPEQRESVVASTTPPEPPNEYACADCGHEQRYPYECLRCHSRRVASIKVIEETFGKDWRQTYFGTHKPEGKR